MTPSTGGRAAIRGRRLPEKAVRHGATAAFVVLGILLIVQGVTA